VPQWVLDIEPVNPEIRVSPNGLSVHFFDALTGLSRVYPTGPGALSQSSGKGVTPTGFYATSPNSGGNCWNIAQRFAPAYFGGFPFASHGCMRMRAEDIVELFYLIQGHPSVTVTIQQLTEIDPSGQPIGVGAQAVNWPMDVCMSGQTVYGELGAKPSNWAPCIVPSGWSFRRYSC